MPPTRPGCRRPRAQGAFRACACAALAGFIIYDIAAFLLLLFGSAVVHSNNGMQSKKVGELHELFFSKVNLGTAKYVFFGLQLGAWCSQVVSLVGLSLYQSYISQVKY